MINIPLSRPIARVSKVGRPHQLIYLTSYDVISAGILASWVTDARKEFPLVNRFGY